MTATMDEIIEDPKSHYETPAKVLSDARFDKAEKRKILEAWHEDALALERAKDESMTGGERSWLHDVTEALDELKD